MKMNVRVMKETDIPACADILRSVYNNELWQCRWSRETAIEYLTDLPMFYKKNGFVDCEHILFMCKEM